MPHYGSHLKARARNLRKNMTDAEIRLWSRIRKKQIAGLQFYRQKPLGNCIIDFYCPAKSLVVEVDGGQHYEDANIEKDAKRDKYFEQELKLKVIRFTNIDVLTNMEGVIIKIMEVCGENPPPSPPLRKGEGTICKKIF